jgi:D-serine deaminase-like pyridoxal phosphate-dependent protein
MIKEISEKDMWYKVDNEKDVHSPALLVYPDRIDYNIRKMIEIACSAERLRPHVKSHKMSEIVKMQLKYGINKFKCATISEAEMVATCGAKDILLAMQPVGPNIDRFIKLIRAFPDTNLSCITDSESIAEQLSSGTTASKKKINVWIDINVGMNRTGIVPGKEAISLFNKILSLPGLNFEGLHIYDGHLHEPDFEKRVKLSNDAFSLAENLESEIKKTYAGHVKKIAGGTPTFPVHALRKDVELSPGTLLLWDRGYGTKFTDLEFKNAAVLLTRVVSKPGKDLLCIDLGHKAVASEMPHPRVFFPEINEFTVTTHSEEHMVIRTSEAEKFNTGDTIYCIPWHICPTVDRHDKVSVVINNKVTGTWKVEARRREITF